MKFRGPTRRDVLHDSENAFLSWFGAEMGTKGWSFVGVSMEDEEERKSNVREREKASEMWAEWGERELLFGLKGFFSFLLFYFKLCHMSPFEWSKRPTFLLMWLMLSHMKRKIWPFEMPKSYLGLRAISLVPVPRVSLRPSGPVFESRQYIYQNA